ncbi:PBECR2 nuclease fold domain-containing protein [Melioribacter sp. OK-6-Me]|uniref:PBECR2 nuclease fold domain-containing protein n=1 Tax=unclassified Melioribacter TaxID=2627329 RepID=UPI003ED841E1
MTTEQLKYLLTLPPRQIVEWYKSKGYKFVWNWQDVWQEQHARAFTVAKAMKLDILQTIKDEVDKIFSEGITYEQFKKDLEPMLKRLGWWGRVKASDVPGYDPKSGIDPDKIVELGSPRRLRTIYQTNANVAYSAGRYKMMIENAEQRPYWQYKQIDRKTKRKSHSYYADKVFRYDDPIWNTIYPPSDWNCGCYVVPLTAAEVEERGLEISNGSDFQIKNIPPEWQYNPGKTYPAWDTIPELYAISKGQKTYADFGRLPARQIKDRQTAPDKFPALDAVGMQQMINLIKQEFELKFRDWNLIDTYDNDKALITLDRMMHLLEKADGRERYIPYIKATLQNPYEIYLTEYVDRNDDANKTLRKTYIGLFNDDETKEDIFVVLNMMDDSTVFWNAFQRKTPQIDKLRVGELLYGRL